MIRRFTVGIIIALLTKCDGLCSESSNNDPVESVYTSLRRERQNFEEGAAALKRRDYESAVSLFSKVLKSSPTNAPALCFRAKAYLEMCEFDKAVNDATAGIRYAPSMYVGYLYRATALTCLSRYDEALADTEAAIRLEPDKSGPCVGRATILMIQKKFDQAITNYDRAISLSPSNPDYYLRRGCAYSGKGEFGKAIENFSNAIDLEPLFASAYAERIRAYRMIRNFEAIISDCTKLIGLTAQTNGWWFFERGWACADSRNNKQAIRDFGEYIRLCPGGAAIGYANRGLIYSREGDFERGIADCRRAVELERTNQVALNNLAWLLSVCPITSYRDGEEALIHAKKAVELSNSTNSLYLGTLAAAYAEAGNFPEAVRSQRQAIKVGFDEEDAKRASDRLLLFEQGKPYREEGNQPGKQ